MLLPSVLFNNVAVGVLLVYCDLDDFFFFFFYWDTVVNIFPPTFYIEIQQEKLHHKAVCNNFTTKQRIRPSVSHTGILHSELLYSVDNPHSYSCGRLCLEV